jgi:hypothetical protein
MFECLISDVIQLRGASPIFSWHILREILLTIFNHYHLIITSIELESIDALGSYARLKKSQQETKSLSTCKKRWFHSHVRQAVPSGRKLGHIIITIPHIEQPTCKNVASLQHDVRG